MKKTLMILAVVAMAASAQAASVTWDTQSYINGTDGLLLTGDLTYAANIGSSDITVAWDTNSITFNAADTTTTGTGNVVFYGNDGSTDSNATTYSGWYDGGTGNANLDNLLSQTAEAAVGNGAGYTTFVLNNLTNGTEYTFQLLASDTRGSDRIIGVGNNNSGADSGIAAITNMNDFGTTPKGVYSMVGSFTADGTSQTFYGFGTRGNLAANAMIVREVPEPATMSLLAVGGIALLRRKRR